MSGFSLCIHWARDRWRSLGAERSCSRPRYGARGGRHRSCQSWHLDLRAPSPV